MNEPVTRADSVHPHARGRVLVSGATGYIGGRLVPRLLGDGWAVRCMARDPRKLQERPWIGHSLVEVISADAADADSLAAAMEGCEAAYYLIHSMMATDEKFRDRDRRLARNFAAAAAKAGVKRILYLGGLGETGEDLSEHLASRREVEDALDSAGVPVTVLRAAIIIGSGSASFEILRYLVERLPVMVTPRWVRTEVQPIAIRNVLGYLVDCLDTPETVGRTLDIGGPEVMTYHDLMRITAECLHIPRRFVIPVPLLTPKLSSLWIHLVTPVSSRIAQPLAEGLKNRVVARDDEAQRLMPQDLLTVRESIETALEAAEHRRYETLWTDAGPMPGDPDFAGGTEFIDRRTMVIDASPEQTFAALCRIGGDHGYYASAPLWRLRGWIDRLVGGPGLRVHRRDPDSIAYGESLDFWRVTDVQKNQRLELHAEMKVPGEAYLEFSLEPVGSPAEKSASEAASEPATDSPENGASASRTRITQTARFRPRGLAGLAYWYAVTPFHTPVFRGLLKGIRKAAEGKTPPAAQT